MSKAGQHHNDAIDSSKPRGHERSSGHNNPSQSQEITTGSYKKHETYEKQAREHKNTEPVGQHQDNTWNEDLRDEVTIRGSTRARNPSSGRSGSDSNADSGTRGH
jgi:hypothetical protein